MCIKPTPQKTPLQRADLGFAFAAPTSSHSQGKMCRQIGPHVAQAPRRLQQEDIFSADVFFCVPRQM
jgi:hypothetical protein